MPTINTKTNPINRLAAPCLPATGPSRWRSCQRRPTATTACAPRQRRRSATRCARSCPSRPNGRPTPTMTGCVFARACVLVVFAFMRLQGGRVQLCCVRSALQVVQLNCVRRQFLTVKHNIVAHTQHKTINPTTPVGHDQPRRAADVARLNGRHPRRGRQRAQADAAGRFSRRARCCFVCLRGEDWVGVDVAVGVRANFKQNSAAAEPQQAHHNPCDSTTNHNQQQQQHSCRCRRSSRSRTSPSAPPRFSTPTTPTARL